jgi:crotonobetainyl-CoA:carnitine CoA-transferase CaiB-like acyl-CoA transferase
VANREALHERLEACLRAEPATHWVKALSAVRVPAGEVNDIASAFALAETLGLDPIVELPAADGRAVRLTRNPIGLSATPAVYLSAPPVLAPVSPQTTQKY